MEVFHTYDMGYLVPTEHFKPRAVFYTRPDARNAIRRYKRKEVKGLEPDQPRREIFWYIAQCMYNE